MDIQQLRYFSVTSRELNYTKAAEQLYISRQALSKPIHELEKELGEPLFVTDKGKLRLTLFGQHLLAGVISIIDSFNDLELSVENWTRQKKRCVNVAIGLGSLTALPPKLFTDLPERCPEISLSLEECSDLEVREKVDSQQVNLGILGCSPESILQFDSWLIQKGQIYLQVCKDNDLARKESIALSEIKDQPFISLGNTCDMHNFFVEKCGEAGFDPNFVMITRDSNTANNMVQLNQGISFGHIQTLNMSANPSIRIIPLRLEGSTWGTYAIGKKGGERTPSTQMLIRYLVETSSRG
jgi:LysR family transcriptional activator of glutamate synthase operon